MLVLGQKKLFACCIIFLSNPLPCASELVLGYQFLSEAALKIILILYIKKKKSRFWDVALNVFKLGQNWTPNPEFTGF